MMNKHMRKTVTFLLTASLAASLCISSLAEENDSAGTLEQTGISDTTGSMAEGAPPEKPDGNGGPSDGDSVHPEKPDGNGGPSDGNDVHPEIPDGNGGPSDGNGAPPEKPDGNFFICAQPTAACISVALRL